MKIAVCVKEVPGTGTRRIDPGSKTLVREGDQQLNPYDSHAVEAALTLREANEGATVTAVLMGPEGASRTLQKALALGADDAVHVTDPALAGSDILATSRALAAALAKGSYDLVLLGQQAGDSDCWVLPGVLAELLEWPVLTQASSLSIDGGVAHVERQTEIGYEKLSSELPAVVSVSDAINTPRYPSLKAIMGAKKKPVATYHLEDLGLAADAVGAAGSRTTVLELEAPPAKGGGVKIDDDGSAAEKIVEFLTSKNLI